MNGTSAAALPDRFEDVEHLEDVMTTPPPWLADRLASVEGDIMILGVAGKMGPTLARLAKRAVPGRRVIGVARFSDSGVRDRLESQGIGTITCDLLDRGAVAALPDAPNIIFMAGRKFGSSGAEWLTWAMNAHAPTLVAERFAGSRIVTLSTACVYPLCAGWRWRRDRGGPAGRAIGGIREFLRRPRALVRVFLTRARHPRAAHSVELRARYALRRPA